LVQSLCPGFVVSKLSGIRKSSLFSPTPEQFVIGALDRISLSSTTGYWSHELQVKFLENNQLIMFLLIFI
jgi:17beta-estradiol 17-dehydrogenase / very-long-chain 3-oxoacyl-CoA reductase